MSTNMVRNTFCLGIGLLFSGIVAVAAAPRPLSDSQLDGVYAAGLDVQVSMDMSLSATNPEAVVVQSANPTLAPAMLQQGITLTRSNIGTINSGSFDSTGAYMPNLQNLVVNNLQISNNALQNASTMMNIFAMQGDVAVGVNLNVVVNPTNSVIAPTQTNVNWGTINLSGSAL